MSIRIIMDMRIKLWASRGGGVPVWKWSPGRLASPGTGGGMAPIGSAKGRGENDQLRRSAGDSGGLPPATKSLAWQQENFGMSFGPILKLALIARRSV